MMWAFYEIYIYTFLLQPMSYIFITVIVTYCYIIYIPTYIEDL